MILFFAFSAFLYFTLLVDIQHVDCVSYEAKCHPAVVESINLDLPNNIYKTKKIIRNTLSQNKSISNYFVKFNYPNRLLVIVETHQPRFALVSNDDGSWYSIIGDNGIVMSIEETTELEYLYVSSLPNPGEFISEDLINSYKIYKNIKFYFEINKVVIMDDGLLLYSERGHQAMLPYDGDPEVLVGAVMVVFDRLNTLAENSIMDNRDYKEFKSLCLDGCLVDFRFHNPVIKEKI